MWLWFAHWCERVDVCDEVCCKVPHPVSRAIQGILKMSFHHQNIKLMFIAENYNVVFCAHVSQKHAICKAIVKRNLSKAHTKKKLLVWFHLLNKGKRRRVIFSRLELCVCFRVVREFGLPDTTVEIMQSAHSYYLDEQLGGPEAHTVPQYRTPTRHPRASQVRVLSLLFGFMTARSTPPLQPVETFPDLLTSVVSSLAQRAV